MNGQPVDTVWDDILPVQARAQERIGYPTQKPLALLERIVKASFFKRSGREIVPLNVHQLLEEDFTAQRMPPTSVTTSQVRQPIRKVRQARK